MKLVLTRERRLNPVKGRRDPTAKGRATVCRNEKKFISKSYLQIRAIADWALLRFLSLVFWILKFDGSEIRVQMGKKAFITSGETIKYRQNKFHFNVELERDSTSFDDESVDEDEQATVTEFKNKKINNIQ